MEKAEAWDNGCCKDDQKQVKLKDAHTQVATYSTITPLASILLTTHFFLIGTYSRSLGTTPFPVYDPPLRSDQTPVYLRCGVFLI
jgi:hypothetical protein